MSTCGPYINVSSRAVKHTIDGELMANPKLQTSSWHVHWQKSLERAKTSLRSVCIPEPSRPILAIISSGRQPIPSYVSAYIQRLDTYKTNNIHLVEVYKVFGHTEGWRESFPLISLEEGVATHFVAAFDPKIIGMYSCRDLLLLAANF